MIDINALLAQTDAFINTMHCVRHSFGLTPEKEHIGTCINYVDLVEMRTQFIEELTNTIVTFVYAPDKQRNIRDAFVAEGREESAAWQSLYRRARKKFRASNLQGQFSELLLCNLLQHYFKAAPLVRKMPLTTNPGMERNGADAIHIAREGDTYRLYVGEAKTYNRQNGSLRAALNDAVSDVVEKHYLRLHEELNLYTYEDFVPPELEDIARRFRDGTLTNVEVHFVCIVAFNEKGEITGATRAKRIESIERRLIEAAADAATAPVFARVSPDLIPRMNYILFPIREMAALIDAFEQQLS
jgi:hypothetical protein